MQLHQLARILSLLASTQMATAYKLNFYRGEGCRSESLGEWVGGPDEGCRNDFKGAAKSAVVQSTGDVDRPFMITFFSSEDCNPDTEIVHGEPDEDGSSCMTAASYGSFAVWDLYAD
ncbi:hypothetical protein QBC37DRAFT_403718 [Rhypophila decipiens]|uniref:Uncharacterized protein n=1 Tax=Rhypophila decipiens TaxID=261697 RepID=A0AAN7B4M8_9PEZI|nr:hypothetical protein QBC37DRAFT_403718 [Rhypophila decipiens]